MTYYSRTRTRTTERWPLRSARPYQSRTNRSYSEEVNDFVVAVVVVCSMRRLELTVVFDDDFVCESDDSGV